MRPISHPWDEFWNHLDQLTDSHSIGTGLVHLGTGLIGCQIGIRLVVNWYLISSWLAHQLAADWMSIGIRFAVDWESIFVTLDVNWLLTGIRLDVNWHKNGCQLVSDWQSIGSKLALHWTLIGCWLTFNFIRLVSELISMASDWISICFGLAFNC